MARISAVGRLFPVFALVFAGSIAVPALGQRIAREDTEYSRDVSRRVWETVARVTEPTHFVPAKQRLLESFDEAIAYAAIGAPEGLRDAAIAIRVLDALRQHSSEENIGLLRFLEARPELFMALGSVLHPEDDPARLFTVLSSLARERGEAAGEFASIAAALCVVHDRPIRHPRHGPIAVSPVVLFDHFADNAKSMEFDPKTIPVEMAVFMVDIAVTPNELRWSFENYKGDRMIGRHYHEVPYDTEHFRTGKPKRIEPHPYILQNLLTYGGICVDQAYFAAQVAKSVGIPSAVVVGHAGEVGHAWVGYLVKARRGAEWNFKEGRYSQYEDVRGTITHPQTGERISDGEVGVLAALMGISKEDRVAAVALTDAAVRLGEIARTDTAWPPAVPTHFEGRQPRGTTPADRLALLEHAVNTSMGHRGAWRAAIDMAKTGELDAQAKMRWSLAVDRVAGRNHPDFSFAVLVPMIRAEQDVSEQDRLWNWAVGAFRARPDLVGAIRLEQARMWEQAGEPARAWTAYQDVIVRFVNDSPVVIDALRSCEAMLRSQEKVNEVVPMYAGAFRRVKPAGRMAAQFRASSNWYKIGVDYVRVLREAGRARDADAVMTQLQASESR